METTEVAGLPNGAHSYRNRLNAGNLESNSNFEALSEVAESDFERNGRIKSEFLNSILNCGSSSSFEVRAFSRVARKALEWKFGRTTGSVIALNFTTALLD